MKNKTIYFLLVVVSFFITSCKKQDASNSVSTTTPETTALPQAPSEVVNGKLTEMVFTEKEFDFGTINPGDKVNHFFTFKNTGKNDLIISKAMGSCGCTVPEFPKEPILPGKTAVMKVSFNSKGKTGNQHKTISVYANVPKGGVTIAIKAKIKV